MKPIVDVFHIGYPKTGTTWLQNELLPRVDEFACLGKPYFRDLRFRDWLNDFVTRPQLDFSPEKARKEFLEILESSAQADDDKKTRIISFELLSGTLFAGYMSAEIALRLKETLGDAKIVVTIRSQSSMIESIYRHYVRAGGALHIRDFLYRRVSPAVDFMNKNMLFQKFEYDKYVSYLYELFGKDRVKVLAMETMFGEPERFASEFFEFCEVGNPPPIEWLHSQHNQSLSYFGLILMRIVHQIFSSPQSDSFVFRPFANLHRPFRKKIMTPLDKLFFRYLFPKKKFIDLPKYFLWERLAMLLFPQFRKEDRSMTIRQEIDKYFKESNRRTAEVTGEDLGRLGYPV